jgi:hypothetical protein
VGMGLEDRASNLKEPMRRQSILQRPAGGRKGLDGFQL